MLAGRLPLVLLVGTGLVLACCSWWIGQDTGPFERWTIVTMAAAVGGQALVLITVLAWRPRRPSRRWLLLVAIAGLALRLAVLPATHELSDDAYRYHWDGKTLAQGVNPYLHAPDQPEVAHLKIHAIDHRINHPWNRTCYPPLAEALFAAGYVISPGSLLGLQVLYLLAEILCWLLLARELERRRVSPVWLLLLIWNPLLIYQGYLPGHLDLLGLPGVAWFVIATGRRRPVAAAIGLAAACLVKPLPLLFLPAAWFRFGFRDSLRLTGILIGIMAVAYVPFVGAGWKLFSSTWLMATDWSFNGSLGAILESRLSLGWAHLVSAVLIGILILAAARRLRTFLGGALAAQAVFICLTPTLFPWYLIGMFPLLVLRPDPALLGLAWLIPLADEVLIDFQLTGLWSENQWLTLIRYLPFYALLVVGMVRRWGMFNPEQDS